jgi:uncharacterized delta-60 repeat protein
MFSRLKKRVAPALVLLAALAVSGGVSQVNAAGGALDTSFAGSGANNWVHAIVVQPDGKILVGGEFTSYNGVPRGGIARVNPNGSLDATFDPGTGTDGGVMAINLQPDGKVIIAGWFTYYDGAPRGRVARLNADGSLDATFTTGAGADDTIFESVLQPDGKVLIAGNFSHYDGAGRNRVARLNADGSLDATFSSSPNPIGSITGLALQPDGKVLLGGGFSHYHDAARPYLVRVNSDGSLDTTFNAAGAGPDNGVTEILLQPNGRIIIGGHFTHYNGTARGRLARLNSTGTLDTSFDPGTGPDLDPADIALTADGKIVLGGGFDTYDNVARKYIAVLNANGSLDEGFVPGTLNSPLGVASLETVAIQPDGRILIGGYFTKYNAATRNYVARLMPSGSGLLSFTAPGFTVGEGDGAAAVTLKREGGTDNRVVAKISVTPGTAGAADYRLPTPGALDASLKTDPGSDNNIYAIAVQPNGKILVAGLFAIYDTPRNRLARVNADGSADYTFFSQVTWPGTVNAIALQPNGKVIAGGSFYDYLARLNSNGSEDTTFNRAGVVNGEVRAVVLQPDGKILVAGDFRDSTGSPTPRVMRLTAAGGVDPSFQFGGYADGPILALALQADGKVLVAGGFTTYDGLAASRILRLNADGTRDSSFNPGTGPSNTVAALALQENGKVVIGGHFNSYNGTARNRVARLNTNGSLDGNFNPGAGADLPVRAVALQPDGKILIGGEFNSYNGVPRGRVARLNTTGSLDVTFKPGAGADGDVLAITLQPDGRILVGGKFFTFNGVGRSHLARLEGDLFVTWPAGDATNKTISLPIVDDFVKEADETFKLSLTPVWGGAGKGALPTTTLTIDENDPVPAISVADVSVTEGEAAKNVVFTVKLSTAYDKTVTVKYETANGTAKSPSDYAAKALTALTFSPGQTTKTVAVQVKGDTLDEADETFKLVLSSPTNSTLPANPATCTIVDNDPTPSISITDATVTEPDTGTVNAIFVVTLSEPSGRMVSVDVAMGGGTATAGKDYTAAEPFKLFFYPGETTAVLFIEVKGDAAAEPDETFFFNLSSVVNATLADEQGLGTITNDD